jgi:hypothetical protein
VIRAHAAGLTHGRVVPWRGCRYRIGVQLGSPELTVGSCIESSGVRSGRSGARASDVRLHPKDRL